MKELIGFKDIKDTEIVPKEFNKAVLFHRTRLGDFFIVDTTVPYKNCTIGHRVFRLYKKKQFRLAGDKLHLHNETWDLKDVIRIVKHQQKEVPLGYPKIFKHTGSLNIELFYTEYHAVTLTEDTGELAKGSPEIYRYNNGHNNSDVWKEISYEEAFEIIEANKPEIKEEGENDK